MEISTTIESQALNLESSKKDTSAENLKTRKLLVKSYLRQQTRNNKTI